MAAMLLTAQPVMAAATYDDGLRCLAEVTAAIPLSSWRLDFLRQAAVPFPLSQMIAELVPAPGQSDRRVGPASGDRAVAWEFRHVPRLVNIDDHMQLVAPFLTGTSVHVGRWVAALALVRLAGARTWQQAAQILGSRAGFGQPDLVIPQRIRDEADFWHGAQAAGRRLVARGLIDYAARHRALRTLTEVPAYAIQAACSQAGIKVTRRWLRDAAAWLWAELTSADAWEAPAFGRHALPNSGRQRLFATPLAVADALLDWGTTYMKAKGAL